MKKLLLGVLSVFVLIALALGLVFFLYPLWVTDQVIRLHFWQEGVRSKEVMVGGNRIHYFEALPPNDQPGTPLILIHGLESRGEDWAGMIPALAAGGFHVYAPDLLGYGRSSKPDLAFSIGQQERAVSDFMKASGITRAHVGGWSMGGWVALKLALDHPEQVDRLVVYDSAGVYFAPTFTAADFAPTTPAGVMRLSELLSPHPKMLPDFVARGAVRKLQRDAWVVSRSIRSMESGSDLLDFRLAGISAPVLIVWGKEDRLIPLAVGEKMHASIPGSNLLVVEGCGHLAPAECLPPVRKATLAFLKSEPVWRGQEQEVPGESRR